MIYAIVERFIPYNLIVPIPDLDSSINACRRKDTEFWTAANGCNCVLMVIYSAMLNSNWKQEKVMKEVANVRDMHCARNLLRFTS